MHLFHAPPHPHPIRDISLLILSQNHTGKAWSPCRVPAGLGPLTDTLICPPQESEFPLARQSRWWVSTADQPLPWNSRSRRLRVLGCSLPRVRLPSMRLSGPRGWNWSKHASMMTLPCPGSGSHTLSVPVRKQSQCLLLSEWLKSPRPVGIWNIAGPGSPRKSWGTYCCAAAMRRKHLSHQRLGKPPAEKSGLVGGSLSIYFYYYYYY